MRGCIRSIAGHASACLHTSVSVTKRFAPMAALSCSVGSRSLFMLGKTASASRPSTSSTSYTSSGLQQVKRHRHHKLPHGVSCCCYMLLPSLLLLPMLPALALRLFVLCGKLTYFSSLTMSTPRCSIAYLPALQRLAAAVANECSTSCVRKMQQRSTGMP